MRKAFEILPLIGIGDLKFGISRKESQTIMRSDLVRNFSDKNRDFYYDSAFQIFFDEKEEIEFIEISRDESIEVIFEDKNIFSIPAEKLIKDISKDYAIDKNDAELGYSFIFPKIELSFWRQFLPEDEFGEEGKYFSTVGIGKKGYFSDRK